MLQSSTASYLFTLYDITTYFSLVAPQNGICQLLFHYVFLKNTVLLIIVSYLACVFLYIF